MKFRTAVGAALLAAALQIPAASAETSPGLALFANEYGETLPPVGYVNFCIANKAECLPYTVEDKIAADRIEMNSDKWNVLYQVNTTVNRKITAKTDQDLYGKSEHWTYPTTAGDCEDYLLLKKRALEKLGMPKKTLRITVVLDENGAGHAVLTVVTNEGEYILDNRNNDILLWNDTPYTFLKRQAAASPRKWVALIDKPAAATTVGTQEN